MRTLVTGGVKSGKSRYALDIALAEFGDPKLFIATAVEMDEEMAERIARHRDERGTGRFGVWTTAEEPLRIDSALKNGTGRFSGVVLDCLPMWVNNLMHYGKEDEFDSILDAVAAGLPENFVAVTNETGLGNIPCDPYARRYNRLLAEANRRLAAVCDRVVLMVAGIPLKVK